jgi:CDP-diacylglycerol--serine O-phosphatidyltransferase
MRRRAELMLPSGLTLANLFFGMWAIVSASRGDPAGFRRAALYVVLGGVCDAFDGRIARATRSGSRFGEELDSLVDAITFGLAPALIMYFAVLDHEGGDWLWAFGFTACAVIRLARFNVESAGRPKTHFTGLPSPAAGMTLATYYWFSQTTLYNETFLADLPWQQTMRYLMLLLGALMISNVQYAKVPMIGYRSIKQILGTMLVLGTIIGIIFFPWSYFFPALILYVAYGLAKTLLLGLMERLPGASDDDDDDDDDADDDLDTLPIEGPPNAAIVTERRRRRRRRRDRLRGSDTQPEVGPE